MRRNDEKCFERVGGEPFYGFTERMGFADAAKAIGGKEWTPIQRRRRRCKYEQTLRTNIWMCCARYAERFGGSFGIRNRGVIVNRRRGTLEKRLRYLG